MIRQTFFVAILIFLFVLSNVAVSQQYTPPKLEAKPESAEEYQKLEPDVLKCLEYMERADHKGITGGKGQG